MALLDYISDDNLFNEVETLLKKAKKKRESAEKTFNANVIDPFGALFEAPGFSSHEEWRNSELARQCQKTIQNHVGTFHQKILGHVNGWQDMGIGGIVDLLNEERKIIAEVKNKYSTVTGGDLADKYKGLEELVSPKHSRFKDYCAYFVNIIPRRPVRSDVPFTPSNKGSGTLCPSNPNIRIIDGASFYQLVTGRPDALKELHAVLPYAIESVLNERLGSKGFSIPDKESFINYFNLAYG
ncbi:Eco47II family restriction endonuclease [Pectobacterium betavasculorum]|uniref:Eco47II family restriction endonuclease n=1 Tax=Pectobacterium betavasculorum TaxID=55207 RepID=UPI00313D0049